MERRIGEQFEYEGVTLEIAEVPHGNLCGDCYFLEKKCVKCTDKIGQCIGTFRNDKKYIYFKEVKI